MENTIDRFYIGAYWKNRKEMLEKVVAPSLKTLKGLGELDNQFVTLYELGMGRKQSLQNKVSITFENIKKLYLEGVKKNEIDESGYSKIGFGMSVWTGHENDESSQISLFVGSGSDVLNNSCLIKFPIVGAARERLLHLDKVKKIMDLLIQNWSPEIVVLNSRELSHSLNTMNEIGWVTYVDKLKNKPKINNKIIHETSYFNGDLFYLKTDKSCAYDYSLINELLPLKKMLE